MAAKKPENMSFESALTELESIVTELEQGNLPLEQALKQFERGIGLARSGQSKLAQAEQKVEILLGTPEQAQLAPFDLNEES